MKEITGRHACLLLKQGQTVNAIETGKYDPALPLAFRIAAVFDRRIEDIFEPEGNPVAKADAPG